MKKLHVDCSILTRGSALSLILYIICFLTLPFDRELKKLRLSSFSSFLFYGLGSNQSGQKMQPLDTYVERIAYTQAISCFYGIKYFLLNLTFNRLRFLLAVY